MSAVPVLCRSILEAWVDLNNVIFEEDYLNCLLFNHYRQVCNMNRVATSMNPVTKMIVEAADFDERKTKALENRDKYKELSKDYDLSTEGRFKSAGLDDEYIKYIHLCTRTHNNLMALGERHIDEDGLALFKYDEKNELLYADMVADILVDAAEYFYGFVKVECKAVMEANKIFDTFSD